MAEASSNPSGRPRMTRSEAARHAALVRYGKEHALGPATGGMSNPKIRARVAEILAANAAKREKKLHPKGKAKGAGGRGKGGASAAAKQAKAKEAAAKKEARVKELAAKKEERAKAKVAADMERTGKQAARAQAQKEKAAERTAKQAERAKQVASKQKQATAQRAKLKQAAEHAKADKAKAKDATDKEKASAREKQAQEKAAAPAKKIADNRAKVAKDMADQDAGLAPGGAQALNDFADGKPLDKQAAQSFEDMGLAEKDESGNHRLTTEGRAAAAAMSKGDTRATLDAISRAASKKKQLEASKAMDWTVKAQSDEERAMFAKMGGGQGKGKGYDKSKSTLRPQNDKGDRPKSHGGGGGSSSGGGSGSSSSSSSSAGHEGHIDAKPPLDSLPQDLRKMTRVQQRALVDHYAKMPLSELRRRQHLVREQQKIAHADYQRSGFSDRVDRGMANLNIMSEALMHAIHKQTFGSGKALGDMLMDDDYTIDELLAIKAGARHSRTDLEHLQAIHDSSVACGASCGPESDDSDEGDMEVGDEAQKAIKGMMDDPGYYAAHECGDIMQASNALANLAMLIQSELAEDDEDIQHISMLCDAAHTLVDFIDSELDELEQAAKDDASETTGSGPMKAIDVREDVNPKEGLSKYGDVAFADAKNKKYPISNETQVRAAWNYINKEDNAAKYDAGEVSQIKAKIVAAWKKLIDKAGPPAAGKALDFLHVDGGAIKALDSDTIGGYAVLFGSADAPDIERDYYTKSTDFWLDHFGWPRPITYHHGMDAATKAAPVIGHWTKATIDDTGVWLEGQLDRAHAYYAAIKQLAERGYLKLSSDSAPQWVVRERQPNGANHVKRWPLVTASTTVTPMEPRMLPVEVKAFLAELGLEGIDDSQEAVNPDAASDATKAADDERARRLLLELELLQLEWETASA